MSSHEPPTIRVATLDDADTIAEFNIALAAESESLALERETISAGVRAVLTDSSKGTYYVASRSGVIVGALMTTYEWSDWRNGMFLWIQSVYVRPEHRKSGVFRALYHHVASLVADGQYCGLRLYVHDHNEQALVTYRKLGMVSHGYALLETPDVLRPDH